ncbi:hypothetical protein GCM10007242_02030 [Pigmentiphaga litoralis]|uniref:ShlB/FhaC/HecB family hemolysin secretion/activation protein n=1 Tax=Pigmentiphaga litoralis TaxID=516702 RepID=UPI001679170A|nr:ShlB/FhaC/HecB family hemolysin secretion/activation protein [Pigmentiphaga litoralis]GGX00772.1 hypothetical protein GCM10007242_02030 [Pigmentiphaga litoralis]
MKVQTFAGSALLCISTAALAQAVPDAGTLLRGIEQQQPRTPAPAPDAAPDRPTPSATPIGTSFQLQRVVLQGVSLMDEAVLMNSLSGLIGQQVTLADLEKATQAIMESYRASGYLARAFLPPQKIADGTVIIQVIEGRFSSVRVEAGDPPARFDADRAARYLTSRQQPGQPFRSDAVERAMLLLNDLPGVQASATLDAGRQLGDTDLILRLADGPRVDGFVDAGNTGARSTGEFQASGALNLNNPLGFGDQASVRVLASEGLKYGRVAYVAPVGVEGLKLGVNASRLDYELKGDFSRLNAEGDSTTAGLTASYPLLRGRLHNLNLVGAADQRDYDNEAQGLTVSDKRTRTVSGGVTGSRYDSFQGGGLTAYSAIVTAGRLRLNDPGSSQTDAIGPRAAGSYQKLYWNVTRQQTLTPRLALTAALTGQFASDNLDSSEKFYLGGPAGVRAYPVNEAGGDEGWLLNVDVNYRVTPEFRLTAFADTGSVRTARNGYATFTGPRRVQLSGAGVGAGASLAGWNARLSIAWRIGDNELANPANGKDTDGTRHVPRIWLQVAKAF